MFLLYAGTPYNQVFLFVQFSMCQFLIFLIPVLGAPYSQVFWAGWGPCWAAKQRVPVALWTGGSDHPLQLPPGDPRPSTDGGAVHGQQASAACGSQASQGSLKGLT